MAGAVSVSTPFVPGATFGSGELMVAPIPSIERLWFPWGPGLVATNRSSWPARTAAGAPSMAKLRKTTLAVCAWADASPARAKQQ